MRVAALAGLTLALSCQSTAVVGRVFVNALQAPQAPSNGWRTLRCDDVRILLHMQGATAELVYDFPL